MTALTTTPNTPTVTPMVLLQQAIDKDINPEQLKQLMDLQERYEAKLAKAAYAAAMVACQREMPIIVRNKLNSQTNSKYAELESIQLKIKPIYMKHGFSLSHGSADSPLPGHYRATCIVTHEGGHSELFVQDVPPDDKGIKGSTNKTPIQAMFSSMTYAQRNMECRIFDLTIANQDHDGNGAGPAVISEEQRITLEEWIASTSSDVAKFCQAFRIAELKELPASKFANAMEMLKRKANQ